MRCLLRSPILVVVHVVCIWQMSAQQFAVDVLVQSPNTSLPVCMAFVPGGSGKFFFTEKNSGRVLIYDGSLLSSPFVTVPVNSGGESGLLGVTVHPQYPDSPYVYIFYTTPSPGSSNRVVRYRDANNTAVDPFTVVDIPGVSGYHNGGNIHFGPDNKLYITVGNYQSDASSQDTANGGNLRGKILRVNADGSIPSDNPFPGKRFWSYGHRNSFDFTFDALTGKMYCTENGPNCDDEVNIVPRRGNLGWPVEGNCSYSGSSLYVRPLYYFASNLPALTGIIAYRGAGFPRLYGRLLFAGNSTATVWSVTLSASGDTIVPGSFGTFFSGNSLTDIESGPDGNIYIVEGPFGANRVLRLRPLAPAFTSSPALSATVGVQYVYAPTFSGTPPSVSIVTGPSGMVVDSSTWSVRWTPTAGQAGAHSVTLRAQNGAGFDTQSYTVNVGVASAEEEEGIPATYVLEQNFPNPFNPSTAIKFAVPKTCQVKLAVFNLMGQEIAVIDEGTRTAGRYEIRLDGAPFASGMYFYRLWAGGFVETKKMIIAR